MGSPNGLCGSQRPVAAASAGCAHSAGGRPRRRCARPPTLSLLARSASRPIWTPTHTPRGVARAASLRVMSLRSLLTYAHEDSAVQALADAAEKDGGSAERAFVSASLRPCLLAALLDSHPERPALVVAGDDRSARDLAADLKAFLSPRLVRLYPARGVRYESHLAPPPHLVGLRLAALDSLGGERPETGSAV